MKRLRISMTRQETISGWLYFVVQLLLLPPLLVSSNQLLPVPLDRSWLDFLFFLINFIAVIVIFHRFLGSTLEALRKKWLDCFKAVILGYASCRILGFLVDFAISRFFPGFSNVNDSTILANIRGNFPLMAIGTVLLVPLAEETLHRGLVFGGLYRVNRPLAYIVSCLVFAAIHVMGYVGKYPPLTLGLCFLQYIPAGLSLAWAYTEGDTILAPVCIHAIINAAAIFSVR